MFFYKSERLDRELLERGVMDGCRYPCSEAEVLAHGGCGEEQERGGDGARLQVGELVGEPVHDYGNGSDYACPVQTLHHVVPPLKYCCLRHLFYIISCLVCQRSLEY